ncbi:MAG TPA: DNA-processing protein DprA [Gaiellales bacterium]|nr:DNA-processing protein DprA [Gaiellales bacterium]
MSVEAELRVVAAAARAGVDAGALARRAGGPARLLSATASRLDALGVVPGFAGELAAARRVDAGEYVAELEARGIVCVARSDPAYPAPLLELADPPLAVFAAGAGAGPPPAIPGRALAIVGARRAGAPALALARRLAAFAAGSGVCVVSGLALGVDAAGHQGALDAGGPTIAVLGCGPDVGYPRTNAGLHRRILDTGLVLSEYPPGTPPAPWRFPARNRLIAALAGAVLVVEARARSGALITADHALDLGRDVLAVPGWAGSPAAAGTNGLLKAGAGMIESEEDLAAWLGLEPPSAAAPRAADAALLAEMACGPAHVEELAARLGSPAHALAAGLSRLELEGWVGRDDAGRYLVVRPLAPGGSGRSGTRRA